LEPVLIGNLVSGSWQLLREDRVLIKLEFAFVDAVWLEISQRSKAIWRVEHDHFGVIITQHVPGDHELAALGKHDGLMDLVNAVREEVLH